MDPRVGGRFEFKLRGAARGFDVVFIGRVTELVPGKKLAYPWESPTHHGEQARPTRPDVQSAQHDYLDIGGAPRRQDQGNDVCIRASMTGSGRSPGTAGATIWDGLPVSAKGDKVSRL
jgi:uncharacterized protein YndB with AHSA1/START domain